MSGLTGAAFQLPRAGMVIRGSVPNHYDGLYARDGHVIWMFAGSECGGKAMAIAFTLIETAKLNGVDPQAWLTDVLSRIAITR